MHRVLRKWLVEVLSSTLSVYIADGNVRMIGLAFLKESRRTNPRLERLPETLDI